MNSTDCNQKLEVLFKTKIRKQWNRPIFDKIKRMKQEKNGRVMSIGSENSPSIRNV